MFSEIDTQLFTRAIELARKTAGGVYPRPPVGAVIARGGAIISEGATEPRPGRHAEIVALDSAGEAANGGTLYCTLEPHGHIGVSPPCTDRIIESGIKRIVCPIFDPNPLVDGKGFRQLRLGGVEVVTKAPAYLIEYTLDLVAGFAHLMKKSRPLITVKMAMSLDGKIATKTGESKWITGEKSRRYVHEMRRTTDAIVTGIGTILSDDPRLTARNDAEKSTGRPKLRVVVDTKGQLSETSAIVNEPGEILWVRGRGLVESIEIKSPNVHAIDLVTINNQIDLSHLVEILTQRGCNNVMVEAGPRLTGAFFDADLVDRIACFIAPIIIGGDRSYSAIGGEGVKTLDAALKLKNTKYFHIGADILVTANSNSRLDTVT